MVQNVFTLPKCEMEPHSEMKARETLAQMALSPVGWYHSHPTFAPHPSLRDIDNQASYQKLCLRDSGVEPFIGIIVTPYDLRNDHDQSKWNYVTISNEKDKNDEYRKIFYI